MNRKEIENIRERVSCATVLAEAGFLLDNRESSRRALKFRRRAEIIIVTHDGAGWFDPLSEDKGDVFALVGRLEALSFSAILSRVAALAGHTIVPTVHLRAGSIGPSPAPLTKWSAKPSLAKGSPSYRYLNQERALPEYLLRLVMKSDIVRQGPNGSTWFRHVDEGGRLSGWEERGPLWRGFSRGGSKTLFRFGAIRALRLCVTEAAIDALSLAALESVRPDTLYVSTGGGWSSATAASIKAVAPGTLLVAATDADPQGEAYADRLRRIAASLGSDFVRIKSKAGDWNEELQRRRGYG